MSNRCLFENLLILIITMDGGQAQNSAPSSFQVLASQGKSGQVKAKSRPSQSVNREEQKDQEGVARIEEDQE